MSVFVDEMTKLCKSSYEQGFDDAIEEVIDTLAKMKGIITPKSLSEALEKHLREGK